MSIHLCAYVYGDIRLTVDVVPRGSSCFLRQGLLLARLSESVGLTVQEPHRYGSVCGGINLSSAVITSGLSPWIFDIGARY